MFFISSIAIAVIY